MALRDRIGLVTLELVYCVLLRYSYLSAAWYFREMVVQTQLVFGPDHESVNKCTYS